MTTFAMTSRERVQATVRGEPVDRVPVMTWLNPHAGLRMMAELQPASNRWAQLLGKWLWTESRIVRMQRMNQAMSKDGLS